MRNQRLRHHDGCRWSTDNPLQEEPSALKQTKIDAEHCQPNIGETAPHNDCMSAGCRQISQRPNRTTTHVSHLTHFALIGRVGDIPTHCMQQCAPCWPNFPGRLLVTFVDFLQNRAHIRTNMAEFSETAPLVADLCPNSVKICPKPAVCFARVRTMTQLPWNSSSLVLAWPPLPRSAIGRQASSFTAPLVVCLSFVFSFVGCVPARRGRAPPPPPSGTRATCGHRATSRCRKRSAPQHRWPRRRHMLRATPLVSDLGSEFVDLRLNLCS